MLSFWEKDALLHYDCIVVGGGIVGLSAACSLAENYPHHKILVIEKGLFPMGASTKNAGFACFGSLTELLADLKKMPEKEVLALVQMRYEGLLALRKRLGDEAMDYLNLGGYELISEKEYDALAHLKPINELLKSYFRQDVYQLVSDKIATFGFNAETVKALILNPLESQIHTGKMMNALWEYTQKLGIRILTGSEVKKVEDVGNKTQVIVHTANEEVVFEATKTLIATNAFTKQLFPHLEINPGRGQVVITQPIPQLRFKGTFHMEEGFYYFRNYQDRVIFGGGRNLDFEGESTTEFATTPLIIDTLKQLLKTVILPSTPFEIAHQWVGIMAFGKTKEPIVEAISANVIAGVRLNGMGVAIGTTIGKKIAEMAF